MLSTILRTSIALVFLATLPNCEVPVAVLCEAGPCDDWGGLDSGTSQGTETDAEAEDTTQYGWVIIVDNTVQDDMSGSAGVDICGIIAQCDGATSNGTDSVIAFGEGMVCGQPDAFGEVCATNPVRNNPRAAEDDGSCRDPSDEQSAYVSLALEGILSVDFSQDLRGCTITVREDGDVGMTEAYKVYVCMNSDSVPTRESDECIGRTFLDETQAGELIISVPN